MPGIWSCQNGTYPGHPVYTLGETKVIGQWTVPVVKMPAFGGLYSFGVDQSDALTVVAVCFDEPTEKMHHYLLVLGDSVEITRLTEDPIDAGAFFIDHGRYVRILNPGGKLVMVDSVLGRTDTVRLSGNRYFTRYTPPVVGSDSGFYLTGTELSNDLKDPEQNHAFFSTSKPLISINNSPPAIDGFFGAYPPDYQEKRIYGYHLSPNTVAGGEFLFLSFPGSGFLGRVEPDLDTTTFYPMSSAYETEYRSMDTTDFMQISKAIQFQDTASRYTQVGYNELCKKVARLYQRHQPIVIGKNPFYGTVVVGHAENGMVESEFIFGADRLSMHHSYLVNKGLLSVEYKTNPAGLEFFSFILHDIYACSEP